MSFAKLLIACVIAIGLVVAGTMAMVSAAPVPEPDKKDDQKKDEPKKDEPKKDDPKGSAGKDDTLPPQYEQMLKRLADSGAVPQERIDQIRKQLQDALKRAGAAGGLPGGLPNLPNLPNFSGKPGRIGRVGLGENLRLGAQLDKPSDALIDQLDLAKGQGQVITQVSDGSAAAKAGIKANDILIELDGKPVSSDPDEFAKQLKDIKADMPVNAVVIRKGKKETLKDLSLPEEPKPTLPGRGRLRNKTVGN